MSDKIHKRVAEVLGMELADEGDEIEFDAGELSYGPIPEAKEVVPVPETVAEIDNPELPALREEMIRIEHGQQQMEVLLNRGITTTVQALGEIALMPPVYKARAMETAAKLLEAVGDLNKFKIEVQIKLAELKLKQAAFTRNKSTQDTPLGTGNTFVFNREEVLRVLTEQKPVLASSDDADDK